MKNIDDEILFKLVKDHLNKSYHERKDKVIHGGTGLAQPAQWYRDFARAVVDVALKDLVLEHEAIKSQQRLSAPAAQAINLLAADHSGMKVDYRGLLSQVQSAIKQSDPGYAEMLRQLEGHLQELGQRWYAGDTNVVDEILQLYCIERDSRKTVRQDAAAAPELLEACKSLLTLTQLMANESYDDESIVEFEIFSEKTKSTRCLVLVFELAKARAAIAKATGAQK